MDKKHKKKLKRAAKKKKEKVIAQEAQTKMKKQFNERIILIMFVR